MPRLSESMAEGTIVRWLHTSGSRVRRGEELAEIETDKATVSFEADADGVLEILVDEGETRPVGGLIARVGTGPTVDRPPPATRPVPTAEAPMTAPPAPPSAPPPGPSAGTAPESPASPARVPSSPLARRLARELGVELASVRGSGPGGRVVRADIEAAARSAAEPRPYAESGPDPRGDASVVRPGQARRVAARRLAEAASAIPVFTLSSEIDMTGCATLRDQLAELVGDGPTPTVTDLVVAASGRALRAFPQVNSAYQDGVVSRFHRVNVGIAVDTPEALLVPTVTDADTRQLIDIAVRTRELAERARAGRITPDELAGATFTVSNLGMFGVTEFAAVINPPQAAILAVGAVRQLPRVRDGAVVVRPVMTVTLSCDHRVLDGAEAAHFLARIRETLERPLALLVNGGTPG